MPPQGPVRARRTLFRAAPIPSGPLPRSMDCQPVPFEALPGFSPLFRAYTEGDERLAPFFAHPRWHEPDAWRAAAEAATAYPRDRAALVEALRAQQPRWGDDLARTAALDRLADDRAVAVVTGQQVNLFGGPLYVPLKAITALQLARQIEAETGRPTVAVFWMATEDHDFPEIDHVRFGATTLRLEAPPRPAHALNGGAVGRLVLPDGIAALVDAAVDALPDAPYAARIADLLRQSYAPGATLGDAFGRLLAGLFEGTGLVLLNPDDPALKRLAPEVFARSVAARGAAEAVNDAGQHLADLGFHAQVTASAPGFFLLDERGRLALDDAGETIRTRLTGETFAPDALADLARTAPERLSASASLRPTWQDALLPVAAYVGGPGEIAYWAQLRPIYDALGVPMPVVYPRTSATLVDAPTRRALARTGLNVATARGDADALFADLLPPDPSRDAAFAEAERALTAAFDALPLGTSDPSLDRARASARTRALNALGRLHAQSRRADRRAHGQLRADVQRVASYLRPVGGLQERALSILPFAARYGPALVPHLLETLPLGEAAHHVVTL